MSTTKNFTAIAPANTTALLTTYGPASSGWASSVMDVRPFDFLLVALAITKGSATTITLKLQATESDGDTFYDAMRVDVDGAAVKDEVTIATSGLGTTDNVMLRFDVRGLPSVRIAAKVDSVTGTPTMSMSAAGSSIQGGLLALP